VGVTPDYPPLIFKQEGRMAGVEADLARELGAALGMHVQFVERRWDHLVPALVANEIDIIMSAMSVTAVRRLRIDFSDPYLDNGILALMRIRDAERFGSRERIVGHTGTIAVKGDTTADVFVQTQCPQARRIVLAKPGDAVYELRRGTIDLFIHDGYYVAWLVAQHEADFTALRTPLAEEQLAWGFRRTDAALRDGVNGALRRWKADGTLAAVVHRWLPRASIAD
jgi:ABC-type amino acid transport substrate-binding protein